MNDTAGKFSLPSSTYIISPLPLFYSLVISIPLCWPARTPIPFSLSWSHLSSSVPLCQSLSRFCPSPPHPSLPRPLLPGMDSGEPISSWSCLLFATVNSATWENGLLSSWRAFWFEQLCSFAPPLNLFGPVAREVTHSGECHSSPQVWWPRLFKNEGPLDSLCQQ